MVSMILQNQLSYDYEDDPSNVTEEQFTKVFIDDNLIPKEQKAFEDDLHIQEQGIVYDFGYVKIAETSPKHHKL